MRRVLALLVLAFLLVPSALAAPDRIASFATTSLRGDQASLAGTLVVGLLEGPDGATMVIEAEQITVETDTSELAVVLGSTAVHSPSESATDILEHAVVDATNAAENGRLMLIPSEGPLTFSSQCVQASASKTPTVSRTAWVNSERPDFEWSTSEAVVVSACSGEAKVQYSGSFVVSLWGWLGDIRHADGQQQLSTGYTAPDGSPGRPDSSLNRAQEAFLHVRNGTFSMPWTPNVVLYVQTADLAATTIEALEVKGQLGGAPIGGDLAVTGNLQATLRGESGLLLVELSGKARDATVNQGPIAVVPPQSFVSSMLTTAVATLALFALALLIRAQGWGVGPWSHESLLVRADKAADQGHYARAVRLTSRYLRRLPEDSTARMVRADALDGLGRHERALADRLACDQDAKLAADFRAGNAIAAAQSNLALGRREEAVRWMRRGLRAHAAMAEAALRNPDLAVLEREFLVVEMPGYT